MQGDFTNRLVRSVRPRCASSQWRCVEDGDRWWSRCGRWVLAIIGTVAPQPLDAGRGYQVRVIVLESVEDGELSDLLIRGLKRARTLCERVSDFCSKGRVFSFRS